MSPALSIIERLVSNGGKIEFYDPFCFEIQIKERTLKGLTNITQSVIEGFDVVVLLTDHDNVYDIILKYSKCLIDKRKVSNIK